MKKMSDVRLVTRWILLLLIVPKCFGVLRAEGAELGDALPRPPGFSAAPSYVVSVLDTHRLYSPLPTIESWSGGTADYGLFFSLVNSELDRVFRFDPTGQSLDKVASWLHAKIVALQIVRLIGDYHAVSFLPSAEEAVGKLNHLRAREAHLKLVTPDPVRMQSYMDQVMSESDMGKNPWLEVGLKNTVPLDPEKELAYRLVGKLLDLQADIKTFEFAFENSMAVTQRERFVAQQTILDELLYLTSVMVFLSHGGDIVDYDEFMLTQEKRLIAINTLLEKTRLPIPSICGKALVRLTRSTESGSRGWKMPSPRQIPRSRWGAG